MENVDFSPAYWSEDLEDIVQGRFDDCAQGTVRFDSNRGVRLDIPLGTLVDTTVRHDGFLTQEGKSLESVYGFTGDGRYLILRDVYANRPGVSIPGCERQILTARSMLASRKTFPSDPNPLIDGVYVWIPGLGEWYGREGVRHWERRGDSGQISFSYTFDSADAEPEVLFTNDGVVIKVNSSVIENHYTNNLGTSEIRRSCNFEIEFLGGPRYLDEAIDGWAITLWRFLCFCMGVRPSIEAVGFRCHEGGYGNLYTPFAGRRGPFFTDDFAHMPIPYSSIKGKAGDILRRWFSLDGDAERASDTLVSLLDDWRMPVNLLFVSCASAFEALSRVGVDVYYLTEDELEERVGIVEASIANEKVRDWAKYNLKHSRRKGADELARSLIRTLGGYALHVAPDSKRFLRDHRRWRNDYIHLNELSVDQMDVAALNTHTCAVWLLGYGAIARLIGIEPEELIRRMADSRFMAEQLYRAQVMYAQDADAGK